MFNENNKSVYLCCSFIWTCECFLSWTDVKFQNKCTNKVVKLACTNQLSWTWVKVNFIRYIIKPDHIKASILIVPLRYLQNRKNLYSVRTVRWRYICCEWFLYYIFYIQKNISNNNNFIDFWKFPPLFLIPYIHI